MPGTPTTRANGGLLTAPTNIGTFTQNKFAFIPQLTMWTLYSNDMKQAFGRVWDGSTDAKAALDDVQEHAEDVFEKRQERWERVVGKLSAEWQKEL